jgi:hypothetical protein
MTTSLSPGFAGAFRPTWLPKPTPQDHNGRCTTHREGGLVRGKAMTKPLVGGRRGHCVARARIQHHCACGSGQEGPTSQFPVAGQERGRRAEQHARRRRRRGLFRRRLFRPGCGSGFYSRRDATSWCGYGRLFGRPHRRADVRHDTGVRRYVRLEPWGLTDGRRPSLGIVFR